MPPPLSTQPGSRAGLVSALVVSIILLLISILCNFYLQSQGAQAEDKLKKMGVKYAHVIASDFSDTTPAYMLLHTDPRGVSTWIDTSVAQTRDLYKRITGSSDTSPVDVEKTGQMVNELLDGTESQLKQSHIEVSLKDKSLKDAIGALSAALMAQHGELTKATATFAAAVSQQNEATARQKEELAQRDQAVEAAKREVAKFQADASASKDGATAAINEASAREKKTMEDSNQAVTQKDVQLATQRQALLKSEQEKSTLRAQLDKWRLRSTDPVLRQADARIIRIGSSNDVFIDLGSNDHVPPGLTFEVYDKSEGVPKLGEGISPDNLPQGKASIEVVDVGQNACRCHIIKATPGQTVSEGDICVNLIYDRHIKLKFFVYGDFDMKGDGVFTAAEADMVKNLVIRWGGTVQNKLTVDTDFVILGKEPEVPTLTKEQEADPILNANNVAKKEALATYEKMINQASTLNIPIMNQTRFLYYTGYFDLVKR
jgi:hypothetical protein